MTSVVPEVPSENHSQPVVQKKCMACNHPYSFHGNGVSRCRAMGCRCEAWVEPASEDPWIEKEHYAAVVSMLRAMEVSSRLVTQGERPMLYVGGYVQVDPEDLSVAAEGSTAVPGEWRAPFAVWANYTGGWAYSVIDEEGQITIGGANVMPHDTEAEEVARIVATWTYPPEEMP
jgi:hypothetical protein